MPQEHPIRKARTAREMSQERLGQAVGVTKATISAWEQGRKLPEPPKALRLKKILGLSLDAIYRSANTDQQKEAA